GRGGGRREEEGKGAAREHPDGSLAGSSCDSWRSRPTPNVTLTYSPAFMGDGNLPRFPGDRSHAAERHPKRPAPPPRRPPARPRRLRGRIGGDQIQCDQRERGAGGGRESAPGEVRRDVEGRPGLESRRDRAGRREGRRPGGLEGKRRREDRHPGTAEGARVQGGRGERSRVERGAEGGDLGGRSGGREAR